MPNRPPHLYAIGDKVFDMPTQQIQTIMAVFVRPEIEGVWASVFDKDAHGDPAFMVSYTVTSPDDPTGDGAFRATNGAGGRCYFEVCDPDEVLELCY